MKKQLFLTVLLLVLFGTAFSQKIYYTEANNNRIRVANLTVGNINTPVDFITGLSSPSKIEVDQINNRLYYLIAGGGDLIAANLGTGATESVVLTTGAMAELNDIAFSDNEGGLFCANGAEVEGIQFVPGNNDDSGLNSSVPLGTYNNHYMNSIAVDDDNGLVFAASSVSSEIMSAPVSGTPNPNILAVLPDPQLIAFDRINNDLYIVSYSASRYRLYRFDMDTGTLSAQLADLGTNWLNDLQIFPTFSKVYYSVESIGIYSVPMSGGAPTQEISLAGAGSIFFSIYNDVVSPVFTALSPADGASNVLTDANFSMTFSENIVKSGTAGTANETGIRLMRMADNSLVELLDRSSASISISNNVATINFATTMDADTEYYILVGSKVFSDYAANNFIGVSTSSGWNVETNPGLSFNRPTSSACVGSYKPYPAITLTETRMADFKPGASRTLFFSPASAGYLFENAIGSVTATGTDITINSFTISSTEIRITYTITASASLDAITISGTRISSNLATNAPTTIIRSGGSGLAEGLVLNTVIANIDTQAQPPAPSLGYNQKSEICLNDDPSGITVTTDGTFARWYTANDLQPASLISGLNDMNTVELAALGLNSSSPGVLTRFVRQNVGGCISLATQFDFRVNEPPQNILTDKTDNTACAPPNGTASVTTINAGSIAGHDFVWMDASLNTLGVTTPMISNIPGGTYHVLVTNSTTGCSSSSSVTLLNAIAPPVIIPPSGDVCESSVGSGNANVDLTTYNNGITSGDGDLSVVWKDAMNNPVTTVVVSNNSTYSYEVTSMSTGCSSAGTLVFAVQAAPTVAVAGPDQSVCGLSATLGATLPTSGTGNWSIISGVGGVIASPGDHNSSFTGFAGATYILRWTVSTSAPCSPSSDEVTIIFNSLPTTSNAGVDQNICGTSTTLAANTAVSGTGGWSVVSGSGGSFLNTTSPTSGFNGSAGTTYTLRWTISGCVNSADEVVIAFVAPPSTATAGLDQIVCGNSTTLAANSPGAGTGAWTIVSGTGGSLGLSSSAASTFTGNAGTVYTLRWTLTNAGCAPTSDEVLITFNGMPTIANAGTDKSFCGTSLPMTGNVPTSGAGAWTIVSGTGGSFANATSATSAFTGLAGTTYTLRWTITNTPCAPSSDEVTVTLVSTPTPANAGADQIVCNTSTVLTANTPTIGTGTWSIVTGVGGTIGNVSNPASTFTGSANVVYTLRWTTTNGICSASSDNVTISLTNPITTAQAGADKNVCGTSVALSANSASSGTGLWSVVSGTGGIVTTPASPTSTFNGIAGNSYVLRWSISKNGCASSTDELSITLRSAPGGTGVITPATALCQGSAATLAVTGVTNATSYQWSVPAGITPVPGTGSSLEITADSGTGGTVTVTPQNDCGAGSAASATIIVLPRPTVEIVLPPSAYIEEPVSFSSISGPSIQSYAWKFGDGATSEEPSPQHAYGIAGNFEILLDVISQNGCAASASASYTVLDEPDLTNLAIKNVITANGDDKNRTLYIENLERFPENEVRFLDRWGVEIFSAANYQNNWEAKGRDGQFLPAGQYICIVKINSSGKVISRTVSILKGR